MIEVYITKANPASKARTLRAIRRALMAVGAPSTLNEASEVLTVLEKDGEAFIGLAEDQVLAANAEAAILEEGCECSIRTTDVDVEALEQPSTLRGSFFEKPESSGSDPTSQSAHLALILLHALDGNPNYAVQIVNAIQRITGDAATWEPVKDVLVDAFPPRNAFQ